MAVGLLWFCLVTWIACWFTSRCVCVYCCFLLTVGVLCVCVVDYRWLIVIVLITCYRSGLGLAYVVWGAC